MTLSSYQRYSKGVIYFILSVTLNVSELLI